MKDENNLTVTGLDLLFLMMIVAAAGYTVSVYPQLPELLPVHFNIHGAPDQYAGKTTGAFGPLLLTAAIYGLMLFLPRLDRNTDYSGMTDSLLAIRLGVGSFLLALWAIVMLIATGYSIRVNQIVPFLLGSLFIILGFAMGGLHPNSFAGIRTPWTMRDNIVWDKTHRLAKYLWIIGGLVIAVLSFTRFSFSGFMAVLIIIVLVPCVYSYWISPKN